MSAELKTGQVGEGEDDAGFKKLLCQYKHVVTQRLRGLKSLRSLENQETIRRKWVWGGI